MTTISMTATLLVSGGVKLSNSITNNDDNIQYTVKYYRKLTSADDSTYTSININSDSVDTTIKDTTKPDPMNLIPYDINTGSGSNLTNTAYPFQAVLTTTIDNKAGTSYSYYASATGSDGSTITSDSTFITYSSGYKGAAISIDGSPKPANTPTVSDINYSLTSFGKPLSLNGAVLGGQYYLHATIFDNAGNSTTSNFSVDLRQPSDIKDITINGMGILNNNDTVILSEDKLYFSSKPSTSPSGGDVQYTYQLTDSSNNIYTVNNSTPYALFSQHPMSTDVNDFSKGNINISVTAIGAFGVRSAKTYSLNFKISYSENKGVVNSTVVGGLSSLIIPVGSPYNSGSITFNHSVSNASQTITDIKVQWTSKYVDDDSWNNWTDAAYASHSVSSSTINHSTLNPTGNNVYKFRFQGINNLNGTTIWYENPYIFSDMTHLFFNNSETLYSAVKLPMASLNSMFNIDPVNNLDIPIKLSSSIKSGSIDLSLPVPKSLTFDGKTLKVSQLPGQATFLLLDKLAKGESFTNNEVYSRITNSFESSMITARQAISSGGNFTYSYGITSNVADTGEVINIDSRQFGDIYYVNSYRESSDNILGSLTYKQTNPGYNVVNYLSTFTWSVNIGSDNNTYWNEVTSPNWNLLDVNGLLGPVMDFTPMSEINSPYSDSDVNGNPLYRHFAYATDSNGSMMSFNMEKLILNDNFEGFQGNSITMPAGNDRGWFGSVPNGTISIDNGDDTDPTAKIIRRSNGTTGKFHPKIINFVKGSKLTLTMDVKAIGISSNSSYNFLYVSFFPNSVSKNSELNPSSTSVTLNLSGSLKNIDGTLSSISLVDSRWTRVTFDIDTTSLDSSMTCVTPILYFGGVNQSISYRNISLDAVDTDFSYIGTMSNGSSTPIYDYSRYTWKPINDGGAYLGKPLDSSYDSSINYTDILYSRILNDGTIDYSSITSSPFNLTPNPYFRGHVFSRSMSDGYQWHPTGTVNLERAYTNRSPFPVINISPNSTLSTRNITTTIGAKITVTFKMKGLTAKTKGNIFSVLNNNNTVSLDGDGTAIGCTVSSLSSFVSSNPNSFDKFSIDFVANSNSIAIKFNNSFQNNLRITDIKIFEIGFVPDKIGLRSTPYPLLADDYSNYDWNDYDGTANFEKSVGMRIGIPYSNINAYPSNSLDIYTNYSLTDVNGDSYTDNDYNFKDANLYRVGDYSLTSYSVYKIDSLNISYPSPTSTMLFSIDNPSNLILPTFDSKIDGINVVANVNINLNIYDTTYKYIISDETGHIYTIGTDLIAHNTGLSSMYYSLSLNGEGDHTITVNVIQGAKTAIVTNIVTVYKNPPINGTVIDKKKYHDSINGDSNALFNDAIFNTTVSNRNESITTYKYGIRNKTIAVLDNFNLPIYSKDSINAVISNIADKNSRNKIYDISSNDIRKSSSNRNIGNENVSLNLLDQYTVPSDPTVNITSSKALSPFSSDGSTDIHVYNDVTINLTNLTDNWEAHCYLDGKEVSPGIPITTSGNHSYFIVYKDKHNYTLSYKHIKLYINKDYMFTPPFIDYSPKGKPSKPLTVSINYSLFNQEDSNIVAKEYSLSTTNGWNPYTGPFTVSAPMIITARKTTTDGMMFTSTLNITIDMLEVPIVVVPVVSDPVPGSTTYLPSVSNELGYTYDFKLNGITYIEGTPITNYSRNIRHFNLKVTGTVNGTGQQASVVKSFDIDTLPPIKPVITNLIDGEINYVDKNFSPVLGYNEDGVDYSYFKGTTRINPSDMFNDQWFTDRYYTFSIIATKRSNQMINFSHYYIDNLKDQTFNTLYSDESPRNKLIPLEVDSGFFNEPGELVVNHRTGDLSVVSSTYNENNKTFDLIDITENVRKTLLNVENIVGSAFKWSTSIQERIDFLNNKYASIKRNNNILQGILTRMESQVAEFSNLQTSVNKVHNDIYSMISKNQSKINNLKSTYLNSILDLNNKSSSISTLRNSMMNLLSTYEDIMSSYALSYYNLRSIELQANMKVLTKDYNNWSSSKNSGYNQLVSIINNF